MCSTDDLRLCLTCISQVIMKQIFHRLFQAASSQVSKVFAFIGALTKDNQIKPRNLIP